MQMSQWTPRRPSDRLTRAIFKPPCPESDVREPGWAVLAAREWAAGLAGCLALLVAGLPGDGGTARGRLADQAAFPLLCALSNQQSAAYHSTRAHSEWNHCARPLLEWTNTSRSTSSMGSFSPRSAN
jgi:hypothetical protein